MAIPLVMLGPGGDFVTRVDIKGRNLVESQALGSTMQQQPDTETGGSFAGYGRMPRRRQGGATGAGGAGGPVGIPLSGGTTPRGRDSFEHCDGRVTAGLYEPVAGGGRRVAQGPYGGPPVAPGHARRGGDLALRPAPRTGGIGADAPRDAAPGGTRAPGESAPRRPARAHRQSRFFQSFRLDSRRPPRRAAERLGVCRRTHTRPRYGGRPCST